MRFGAGVFYFLSFFGAILDMHEGCIFLYLVVFCSFLTGKALGRLVCAMWEMDL